MSDVSAMTLNVSRETFKRLDQFTQLLKKWNSRINLVSRNTISNFWTRHIMDSLQVYRAGKPGQNWVDLGSGGGLPGLVVAIAALDDNPAMQTHLVESDQRKCAFLHTVIRELSLNAIVHTGRIEVIDPLNADVLSARALAPLPMLLKFSMRHLAQNGLAVFPKGESWQIEMNNVRNAWRFDCETIKSEIEPRAVVLKIRRVSRV
ncbi:MAG: 16S rRNA (guanine(527)-N(7))-methyltransferase RsmG [Rhodobacteraceae bacterium]|nr:16S rRNA (guanine(527)-N(7))-methyltransferase RsmG [Paracoccaceae bacterium]